MVLIILVTGRLVKVIFTGCHITGIGESTGTK
jgi:hypothetical protein